VKLRGVGFVKQVGFKPRVKERGRGEFFTVRINHSRRGHSYKLYVPGGKTTARYNYFSYRVLGMLFHLMMLILSQCIDFVIV